MGLDVFLGSIAGLVVGNMRACEEGWDLVGIGTYRSGTGKLGAGWGLVIAVVIAFELVLGKEGPKGAMEILVG